MKKYFLSLVALAAMLFATSCQESLVEPQVGGTTTFTVQVPDQMGTKAIGDASSVTELLVDVYAQNGTAPIYQTKGTHNGYGFDVQLNLIQDQAYDILFWAQTGNGYVEVITTTDGKPSFGSLRSVPMNANFLNNDNGAAFFHAEKGFVPNGTSKNITLVRPFAQLNLGTTDESLRTDAGTFKLVSSSIKVTGMANQFNVFEGLGFGETVATYDYGTEEVPQEGLSVSGVQDPFNYVSMNYLAVLGNEKALVDVEASIVVKNIATNETQTIYHTFTNVPVQENYRTNIVGNLISSTTDFVVKVDNAFAKDDNETLLPDNDYYVVDNVEAANTALTNGESHVAINMIEKEAPAINIDANDIETLYLQLPDTDADVTVSGDKVKTIYISVPNVDPTNRGLNITINTPKSHVEISGQISSMPGVSTSNTTLVLNGAIVTEIIVINQGNVVVGEGSEILGKIKSDEAVVIFNSSDEEIEVEGENIVVVQGSQDEINVSSLAELYAAVEVIDAGGVVNIDDNIEGVDEVVCLKKDITINGNGKSISGSASRIFRIVNPSLMVEMNDLNIVSKAVRDGTNDIRGISIDPKPVTKVSLTLNNCSVDFTDPSACDRSYAVNISGYREDKTEHEITIIEGSYEGANVINANGIGHTITVTDATLTSLYPYSDVESNYGSCIYLVKDGKSNLNVENTIFKGVHAVAINTREGNSVEENNNTDCTKRAEVKVGSEYFNTLADAVASIESEGEIKILRNLVIDCTITIANDKNITLNLNEKTITGVDELSGDYSLIDNSGTLTIHGPGKMTLSISEGNNKVGYSAVIANNPGGELYIAEDVVIEHLGETDNSYEIYAPKPVATVGNTEYYSINEAIANWTNGSTLTLLADVTLSDVVTLKSTEHHILNLATYTMTAASGKHAIEITCNGRSSASYALTINADATNPGGITATGKSCIYYKKSDSTKDRPIILINNGVFTGSYSINSTSNGNTNCPQVWINGGVFNSYMNLTKNMLRISGGTFHAAINCTGDSSAYREIKGGRFKSWQFMTADASNKFWVGSGIGNYDVGCYVDDEGYLVVGGPVITEFGDKFAAKATNYSKWSSYLKYSSVAEYGLYYTNAELAIKKHGEANVVLK